jgi:Tol biopolymer transport system component/DNA-binding winged helix-turn-helix (wHTH) protein
MGLGNGKSTIYEFDEFRVDPHRQVLLRGDEPVSLTPKVFEMLTAFLERPGELLPKEELMERLWPDSFVEEANLAQNVAVLRKALGDNSKSPKYIATIAGRGYRFVADVRYADANGHQPTDSESFAETDAPLLSSDGRGMSAGVKIAAAALGGVILAAAVWLLVRELSAPAGVTVERTSQLTAWSGLDFYPVISPDGRVLAFCSDRTGSLEIFTRQMLQGAKEVQVTNDGAQNCQPSFSPDGSQLAYASHGSRPGIYVIPSNGGTARQLSTFGTRPAWSPDGTQIAFQSDPLNDLGSNVRNAMPPSTLWLVSVNGGEPRRLTRPGQPPGGHGAPSWSPDGKRIVFDVNDWAISELWTVSVADGAVAPVDVTETRSESEAVFSPDGNSIFFVMDTGTSIGTVPIGADGKAAGGVAKVIDASGTRVRQISIDRAGKRIVYATLSTASNVWLTPVIGERAEPMPLTKHAHTRTVLPAYSPDGKRIAYQSFKTGSLAHLWIMNADGSEQRQLSSRPAFNAAWSADNSTVWFISPEPVGTSYWSVNADTGLERRLLDFDEVEVYGARAAPDGSQVIFNSKRDGKLNIWTMPLSGGEPRQLTFDPEFAGFPAWSPDSRSIAVQIKRGDNTHVGVMPANGGEIVQLTNEKGQSWVNGWSGDNDRIIFAGMRNGIWNVYSVSRTTREVRQLTYFDKINAYVRYPSMSPAGDKVAYEYAETTGNVWMVELK